MTHCLEMGHMGFKTVSRCFINCITRLLFEPVKRCTQSFKLSENNLCANLITYTWLFQFLCVWGGRVGDTISHFYGFYPTALTPWLSRYCFRSWCPDGWAGGGKKFVWAISQKP